MKLTRSAYIHSTELNGLQTMLQTLTLGKNPKHNFSKISPFHLGEDPEIVVSIEVHFREASHSIFFIRSFKVP